MIQIDRSALAQSRIAGGVQKQTGTCSNDSTPAVSSDHGSTSSLVVVNGKTVVDRTVTY
ncbi:hypothetical protein AWB78_01026 [Caballeronia calidae]|uniref:Uncharacterized protein n=1 Tax=Caballeronia calidae TaxID=1777139 RepID=A0A157ZWE0_9BURK|nr:hypothetical protein AWB78_01026 [Caballeronia calidae]